MKINKIPFLILPLVIASCGGNVKEELGLKREAPDEFSVERKPRLEVPPEFKIRPPAPGERPLNAKETSEEAKEILFSNPSSSSDKSSAENALLGKVGAGNSDIRKTLDDEYREGVDDPTILERVRSISDDEAAQTLVDPEAERKRISENKQQEKPVTEGEVKTKSDGKTVIDKILGE